MDWLGAYAVADLAAKGSAADSIAVTLGASLSNFSYQDGGTSITADALEVSTGTRAGVDPKTMTAQGPNSTRLHADNLRIDKKKTRE